MTEKSEKPYIFNEEDKELIRKAVLNFLVNSIAKIEECSDPKHLADIVSKDILSDKGKLKTFSLMIMGKNPSGTALRPGEFKEDLSNKLTNPYNPLSDEIAKNLITLSNSLNHKVLYEKIFGKIQEEGILDNIQGDKNYKKYFPSKRGRRSPYSSDETIGENKGRKSIYLVNAEIERFKEIFQKPLARKYFIDELIKTEYVDYIFKFIWKTSFYVFKKSESTSLQAIQQGTELLELKLNQKDLDNLPDYISRIKNLSDEQIENYADMAVKNMVRERELFFSLIPIFGLIKLIDKK